MKQPKQPSKKPTDRKRPLPLRRFEEAAESLAEEEKSGRSRSEPEDLLDEAELPSYLRRRDRKAPTTSSLVRLSLLATVGVSVVAVSVALLLRPDPNPEVPAGVKVDRGLAVLASPRGFTAALYPAGSTTRRLLSIQDGQGGDERDGFVWFKNVPSATVPAGNYALVLTAPEHQQQRLSVTIQSGKPTQISYNTNTALKKAGS